MKGQFEVQFNWIFILIAGAVILAFFFSIVLKQRTLSDERLALTLANELDAITTGASIAKGAAQTLPLPKTGIDFQCSDECTCTFSIGRTSKNYRDKLIFAPHRIEGDTIVFWTLDWNTPFRAANFLLVTNDRIKYFFVHDDSAASQQLVAATRALLPEQANADFVTLEDVDCSDNLCVKNENYVRVKFVFLNTDPNFGSLQLDDSFSDTELAATHITPGIITFFKRTSKTAASFTESTSFYAGDTTMFAAIFADDETMYRCNLQSALGKLSYVSDILRARVDTFREDATLADHCSYNTGTLENIGRVAADQRITLNEGISELGTLVSTLIDENELLLRQSCPTVY